MMFTSAESQGKYKLILRECLVELHLLYLLRGKTNLCTIHWVKSGQVCAQTEAKPDSPSVSNASHGIFYGRSKIIVFLS